VSQVDCGARNAGRVIKASLSIIISTPRIGAEFAFKNLKVRSQEMTSERRVNLHHFIYVFFPIGTSLNQYAFFYGGAK